MGGDFGVEPLATSTQSHLCVCVFTLNPTVSAYSLTASSAIFSRLQPRINLS